ncbi:hypothetical protein TWF103_011247 [Orbilia oligospora]|nr:hypothetical protein TWF103_011247 [Orbilia oligospora]
MAQCPMENKNVPCRGTKHSNLRIYAGHDIFSTLSLPITRALGLVKRQHFVQCWEHEIIFDIQRPTTARHCMRSRFCPKLSQIRDALGTSFRRKKLISLIARRFQFSPIQRSDTKFRLHNTIISVLPSDRRTPVEPSSVFPLPAGPTIIGDI